MMSDCYFRADISTYDNATGSVVQRCTDETSNIQSPVIGVSFQRSKSDCPAAFGKTKQGSASLALNRHITFIDKSNAAQTMLTLKILGKFIASHYLAFGRYPKYDGSCCSNIQRPDRG